ncbi:MAG: hypothetical protein AABM32_13965 [Chloroflexota bacterium]
MATWARIALIALAVLAVAVPNLPTRRVPSEDAGVFFYVANTLLAGGVPYRDVWDHKPPAVYVIDAIGLAAGGPMGVWVLQLAALAIAAVLSYRVMASAFAPTAALAGTLAWILAAPRLFLEDGTQTSFVELYALPLQFAAFGLYSVSTARRSAFSGVLLGLAGLLKPTLVGTWVAIVLRELWRFARGDDRRGAVGRLMLLGLGATVVLVIAVAAFALARGLPWAVDQAVRYNLLYSAFATPSARLDAVLDGARLTLPSGLFAAGVLGWALALADRRPRPVLVSLVLVALPVEIVLATSGRAYHYYFLAWLPSLGVLAGYLASRALSFRPRFGTIVVAGALVAMSVRPTMLVARLAVLGDDGASRGAAAYVREHSAAGDLVLVWGSRTEINVLAERRSPTSYVYQYAPLATRGYSTPERFAAFLEDLERTRPLLIVDASKDSVVTPPLDRAGFASWTSPEPQYMWPDGASRIVDFVEANYEKVTTLPQTGWPVWRLRSR